MANQILDDELYTSKRKPLNLAVLAVVLIGMGGMIGATTNFINGMVSEDYFRLVMGWEFEGIWKAAIFQGIFEGIIYGLIYSIIFTIGFALITKRKADWAFAKTQLKPIVYIIYGCWIIGGVIGILLAFSFPVYYDRLVYFVPSEVIPRIRFAWVGGSIWGATTGGVFAVFWGLWKTYRAWGKLM